MTIDVAGVGYRVTLPPVVWEQMTDGEERLLHVSTYVREDRFDLFGFLSSADRFLFERLLSISGIGPKMALELVGVPRSLLARAIRDDDADALTDIKGIGRKTAEKLLLELKSLEEKDPTMFATDTAGSSAQSVDRDAAEALSALGYDARTIRAVLRALSPELTTTEERVTAALRSL